MSWTAPETAAADSWGPRNPLRVLLVEDSRPEAELCLRELKKAGFEVCADLVQTPEEFSERLRSSTYDIVLADYRLPGWTGLEALALLRQLGQDVPFLLVTGTLGEEAAVECIKQGVTEYVLKDRLARLPVAVKRALEEKAHREERARAERALRESEASFRLLFANNPLPMWVFDGETLQFLQVNDAAIAHYGYSREEFLQMRITDIRPPEEVPRLLTYLAERPAALQFGGQWRHRLKDGRIIDVETVGHSLVFARRQAALVVVRDITARKQAEEALREREARYHVLAETATDAIVTINSESRILFVNAAAERIFGYGRAEMLGQDLTMLMPEYLREVHKAGLKRYLGSGQRHLNWESVQITGLHKSGAEIPVEVSFGEFVADGEHTFTGIIRDITERRRAQEALREANEKLTARVNELEQLTREITLVNQMGELLHTCATAQEAYGVIGQCAQHLFPGKAGALCVLNASRNLVEAVAVWGDSVPGEPVFSPGECWALRRAQAHLVEGPGSTPFCGHVSQSPPASSLCVPMMAQGEALGVLLLKGGPEDPGAPPDSPKHLTKLQQRLAVNVAEHIALALANLRLQETLRTQSIHDPLTGLHNRRYLEESLERELRRAVRKQRPMGVIMLDLDHLKQFNDRFGHEAGDTLLRELGHFLQACTRREDIACRYGGDEFLLILPEAWLEVTRERAEQLREEVKRLNIHYRGHTLGAVTLSLGVVAFPEHGSTASTLLRAADVALYCAKTEGRDRVVIGQAIEEDEDYAPPPQAGVAHPPGKPK